MWGNPVASLTCLRPSLLPRSLRPRRRGRTCGERQKERRVNRTGVALAGVSAPPRLTWLRFALKRRGERRLAPSPTQTSPYHPWGYTHTRSTIESRAPPAASGPDPAQHVGVGEASPGRALAGPGKSLTARGEGRGFPGAAQRAAGGECPVGCGRRGSGPERPTCPSVPQRIGTFEEPGQGEGQGGWREARCGAAAAAEPGQGQPPSRRERLLLRPQQPQP